MIDPELVEAAARAVVNLRGWVQDPEPAIEDYDFERAAAVLEVVVPLIEAKYEQVGTADCKDRLVSLDEDWMYVPARMLLPHPVFVRVEGP